MIEIKHNCHLKQCFRINSVNSEVEYCVGDAENHFLMTLWMPEDIYWEYALSNASSLVGLSCDA